MQQALTAEGGIRFEDTGTRRYWIAWTMSQFDRLTGVKHLRVRGLKAVSFAATLKALGLNILRSTRFKDEQKVAFAV